MGRVPVATDDFNRTNEDPLASPWGGYIGAGNLRLVSGAVYAGPVAVTNIQTHNASLSTRQYVQAVAAQPDILTGLALVLRMPAPGATVTGYMLYGGFSLAPVIYRFDNVSTYAPLHTCTGLIATGHVVSFEADGDQIIAYLNGAEIGRATDATYGSGVAGLSVYISTGGGGSWDDFACGDIAEEGSLRAINYRGA